MINDDDVPIWEKYTLTIEEAAKYFRIGENKLRKLAEENPAAGWVLIERHPPSKIVAAVDCYAPFFMVHIENGSGIIRLKKGNCGENI